MKSMSDFFRPGAGAGDHVSRARRGTSLRNGVLFAGACAFALGCAAASADDVWEANWPTAASLQASSAAAATNELQAPYRGPDLDLSNEAIERLRQSAQVGDVDAVVALAARLLERFEQGGTSDDLFEAMVWIDRYQANDNFAQSGLVTRVQQRDCRHRVMRLHPVCDVAE